MKGPGVTANELDFAFLQAFLREQVGFVLEDEKRYLVDVRLSPLLATTGLRSLSELVSRLRSGKEAALERVTLEAMLNGETTFFRDIACFEALRTLVIPRLIERRQAERRLELWCACCSTGQEPYSLAMMLAECFPQLEEWNVRILATDYSAASLERARAGRYAQFEINRGLPAAYLVKYFDQSETHWTVSPDIRRRVHFAEQNLMRPWPLVSDVDVVLLRNVMIYWELSTKREVLSRIRQTLRPDGYLVLGGAETTYYADEAFDRVNAESACIFQLKG